MTMRSGLRAVLLAALLLSACTVPEVDWTPTPALPTVMPEVTPEQTPEATEEPGLTPTVEVACAPDSYAMVLQDTELYRDIHLTEIVAGVEAGTFVLLKSDAAGGRRWVVTATGDRHEGWIVTGYLPEACR